MRGKEPQNVTSINFYRITPAYAGKSASEAPRKAALQDHPRLCGEKDRSNVQWKACIGSPPPMRGKVCVIRHQHSPHGITPAYAGKRGDTVRPAAGTGDHPRLCGEKLSVIIIHHSGTGSPPPMRGKELTHATLQTSDRITPAYAGKRTAWTVSHKTATGSPPPMRGKAQVYIGAGVTERITPAYAGKSWW